MNARCHSHPIWPVECAALTAALLLTAAQPAAAQPGWVLSHQKISDTQGGFTGILDDGDLFSSSVASLGDLDGDAVDDLAVGAQYDDDGGSGRGAVWILFLNTDGTVKSRQKISDTGGGSTGTLNSGDWFGRPVASLGDLDGDGALNDGDIDPFFFAFGDPTGYAAQFPNCDPLLGDMNGDGQLNGRDIDPILGCLGRMCP